MPAFLRFVRGSLAPRWFFVLFPAVFRGFSFFFSPASDAGFSLFYAPPCISAPVSILPDAIRHLDPALGCLPAGGSLRTFPQTAVG